MTEQLYGVSFSPRQNYLGRDKNGVLVFSNFSLDGRLMTRECAEDLCKLLRSKYPNVSVVELLRGEKDELVANSLADLGEETPIQQIKRLVREAVSYGSSREQILVAVESEIVQAAK